MLSGLNDALADAHAQARITPPPSESSSSSEDDEQFRLYGAQQAYSPEAIKFEMDIERMNTRWKLALMKRPDPEKKKVKVRVPLTKVRTQWWRSSLPPSHPQSKPVIQTLFPFLDVWS